MQIKQSTNKPPIKGPFLFVKKISRRKMLKSVWEQRGRMKGVERDGEI